MTLYDKIQKFFIYSDVSLPSITELLTSSLPHIIGVSDSWSLSGVWGLHVRVIWN